MKPEGRARAPGEHVMGLSRRRNDLHRVETIEVHLGPAHTPLVHERRVARCRSAALPVLRFLLDSVMVAGMIYEFEKF